MNSQIQNTHRQAMEWADQAFVAQINGDPDQARELSRQAFALEREAALAVAGDVAAEPTRSVLLRSAASLAMDCGELREAERLITLALSGEPPSEIAEELRDLYDQVNLQRRKATRKRIVIQGELRHADAPKTEAGRIWLVEEDGTKREIIVPQGMMARIVKPLWEDTVEVTGIRTGKKIVLETIQRVAV